MTESARTAVILMILNIVIFVMMFGAWLLRVVFPGLPEMLAGGLMLPGSFAALLHRPWTLLTYMFTHLDFLHLFVNMLWLIGFGAMIHGGWRSVTGVYIAGGLTGALFYLIFSALQPDTASGLAGASASVISLVTAAAIQSPDRILNILFIGQVKLKWVALTVLTFLLLSAPLFSAPAAAHAGGIVAGIISGILLKRKDREISRKALETARRYTRRQILLHKVEQSGFTSLSEPERLELFNLK